MFFLAKNKKQKNYITKRNLDLPSCLKGRVPRKKLKKIDVSENVLQADPDSCHGYHL